MNSVDPLPGKLKETCQKESAHKVVETPGKGFQSCASTGRRNGGLNSEGSSCIMYRGWQKLRQVQFLEHTPTGCMLRQQLLGRRDPGILSEPSVQLLLQ